MTNIEKEITELLKRVDVGYLYDESGDNVTKEVAKYIHQARVEEYKKGREDMLKTVLDAATETEISQNMKDILQAVTSENND